MAQQETEPIRIGIIGAGANTRARHIPGFQAIPAVSIEVICNRTEESSRRVAEQFNVPRIASRWMDVVRDEEVDAVMIGTWPYLHAEAAIAALENGKHVLTEARMACNLDEAKRMVAAAEAHPKQVAQVVPAPFSLEVDETVRELVGGGELGPLREVIVTHTTGSLADPATPMHWRQDYELSGKNVLTLGICHEIVLRWVEEEAMPTHADAEVFTGFRLDPSSGLMKEVRIPDSLTVLGRFSSGARLVYHFSGVEAGQARGEIRLNGMKQCLRFELGSGRLWLAEVGGQEREVEVPPEKRRGWRVEEDFIASIREGTAVRLTSFPDALRYMRFTDAVWQLTGRT